MKSLEHLYSLGALTDEGKLSDPIGVRMSRFPLEPMYAKAMLISCDMGCSEEMLATVSMMSVDSVFYAPRDKLQEVYLLNYFTKLLVVNTSLSPAISLHSSYCNTLPLSFSRQTMLENDF